jgi:hypothetical protein
MVALTVNEALQIVGVRHSGIMELRPPAEKSGSRL